MLRNRRAFVIWLFLICFVAGVIFQASNTPYQQQDIQPFLRAHFQWTANTFPHISFMYGGEMISTLDPYAFAEFVLRKLSHVTEYALFAFLLTNLMLTTTLKRNLSYLLGFILSIGYAGLDEWHQTFIPGRTGHAIDVFTFDTAGILLALALTFFLRWLFKITIKK